MPSGEYIKTITAAFIMCRLRRVNR